MLALQKEFNVTVSFYSFFKDLAGCASCSQTVAVNTTTLSALVDLIASRFPKLAPMRNSMLIAVGVEYQDRNYVLKEGDEVSLFPPVQGG